MLITYTYECETCGHFQVQCRRQDYKEKIKCPTCKKKCGRDFSCDNVNGQVRKAKSEITTLGHLAERNSKEMSADEKRALTRKHYEYRKPTEADLKENPYLGDREFVNPADNMSFD